MPEMPNARHVYDGPEDRKGGSDVIGKDESEVQEVKVRRAKAKSVAGSRWNGSPQDLRGRVVSDALGENVDMTAAEHDVDSLNARCGLSFVYEVLPWP